MGILFSQLRKKEPVSDQSLTYEYFSPATSFVVEHYLENSVEYETAVVESMQGVFIAVKENRVEIAVDAFVDCVKRLIKWFKKWFLKFINFVKTSFHKLDTYFLKGKVVIDRFLKTTPDFEPFVLSGYQYTIPTSAINSNLLYNYMSMVDEEILNVLRADSTTLNARIAKAQEKLGSSKLMDYFRGVLLNRAPVKSSVFRHELKHYFRNNNLKADILCNMQTVTGFCEEYKLLSKQIDSIKQNRMSIEIQTNRILDFLEHEPEKYFDGYSTGSDLDRRKNLGIGAVYSSANVIIKQLNFMYDFYFSAKLDAINEALQFYVRAASKALGSSALGMAKFAREDFIPDVDISKEPITENNLIFSEENYELNFDKWKTGEIKILFIIGLSGSGKSTLADKLAKEYQCRKVELDFYGLLVRRESPEIEEMSSQERNRYIVNHVIEHYKNERVIIEGAQIIYCDPEVISQYAVIAMGTSAMTSTFRGIKRSLTDFDREANFTGMRNPILLFLHALFRSSPTVLRWNCKTNALQDKFKEDLCKSGDCL